MNHEITVFLDMDGVLVGFAAGFQRVSKGMTFDDYAAKYGKQAAVRHFQVRTEDYWADLGWERGGKEVYKAAKKLYRDVRILSSCGSKDENDKVKMMRKGKMMWIEKNGLDFNEINIVPNRHDKQKFATPMSILVDDLGSNIREWNLADGLGILHDSRNYEDSIIELFELSRPSTFSELAKHINIRRS